MKFRLVGVLLLAALFVGVVAPASSVASAQSSAILEEIAVRDKLVVAQESLLNTYRCLYDIDTHAVSGGCVHGNPAEGPVAPGEFHGVPTAEEVVVRDKLIAAQELLLNAYRCRFGIDAQLVPGGCVDGKPADVPEVVEEPPFVFDDEKCRGLRLVSTDIGITDDTITVLVMADVGSPLSPGRFQGSIDAVKAWAGKLNSEGGLACRRIEVLEHDSQLNPTETTNGFLAACENALALVGTTALFVLDSTDLQTCPDARGNEVGVPDFAFTATEPPHQCSKITFAISRPSVGCPYSGHGPRTAQSQVGPVWWILKNVQPDLHGVYLIPGDLPSTIMSTMPQIRSFQEIGVVIDAEPWVSGFTTQAEYGAFLQTMREANSNFAYTGSDDQSMIKWRSEADALGLNSDNVIWMCSQACYTSAFLEAGAEIEGTYVWLPFLPFEEAAQNQELADFMAAIDDPFPPAWAAGSWAAGVLFEQIVNDVVAEGGLNALTRQAVLDRVRSLNSFDVNGWWGPADFTSTEKARPCFVMLQVQDRAFKRVYPEAKGTLDCNPNNLVALTRDWAQEFKG
ncbi:MAG: ABC transporter substrate-binding protein [Acidimicrobiia bacterium]|nr:ABC transporter substrate-binding protein [Acidimicrobiia bacterium]